MLKALELIGFKSFAEKTRFEFPSGITAVVGPNGSGKSNVVDAIKWVLGEQSVKSLRGKEMADVIFNGSGSRGALNTAEVTLTFDNTKRALPLDTNEVHITRRVYRSGEGEYLINRQPSRLRDIRELFFGTGVGAEAYSVIEQGKVDSMLQSSPRDRRMIFEEAAGISRFKAKKVESLRRLERVEQNLLRLSDIVSEVEGRLRSVRLQATKARRYQEYADRMQALRTQVALVDWRGLGDKLTTAESAVAELERSRDDTQAQVEQLDARLQQLDADLTTQDDTLRRHEALTAEVREQLLACEATIAHETDRTVECEQALLRQRQTLSGLDLRAGDVRQQVHETLAMLSQAQHEHQALVERLAHDERRLSEVLSQLDTQRQQESYCRSSHVQAMRSSAALGREISSFDTQLLAAQDTLVRQQRQLAELTTTRETLERQQQSLIEQQVEFTRAAEQQQHALTAKLAQTHELRGELQRRTRDLADQRQRHAVAVERATLLSELESRFEGLTAGVKEVLLNARESTAGPFRDVHGLVADLIRAPVEYAPLIDIALGECGQHVVVGPDDELTSLLSEQPYPLTGRVAFIRLSTIGERGASGADLSPEPGVIGRAAQLVEAAGDFQPLVERLLGTTWLVERLSHALTLSRTVGQGCAFVTRDGELLAADGTLHVGPRHATTGLVSRRSELRALRKLIDELELGIAQNAAICEHLAEQSQLAEREQQQAAQAQLAAQQALIEHRGKIQAAEQQRARIDEQWQGIVAERRDAELKIAEATQQRRLCQQHRDEAEKQVLAAEEQLTALASRLGELVLAREAAEQRTTELKVEQARSDARLNHLLSRQQQFERDQQERRQAIDLSRGELLQIEHRLSASQLCILRAESHSAELHARKEQLSAQTQAFVTIRDRGRVERGELAQQAQLHRGQVRKFEEQLHQRQLQVQEVRLERTTLAERMREDYSLDLAALESQPSDDGRPRSEVEQEISELRRKLQNLGNVNLDALAELDDLEQRFTALSAQHTDLTKAKQALEQIIQKINVDSRRLFVETLEHVKVNFQALFRKLFGGGQADIVLEAGEDVLESGIEIIARPPGKELRSISLMSGGEKTMTCVALLLAIFQYRPSPFCVLDEVDAALDEANIERFAGVLREFLSWTQFIVITHSKKTMTCASTLYGVTMQESGISKRVAVRFDDVHEDGRIDPAAEREQDETEAA